jgi:hypothetical protein
VTGTKPPPPPGYEDAFVSSNAPSSRPDRSLGASLSWCQRHGGDARRE